MTIHKKQPNTQDIAVRNFLEKVVIDVGVGRLSQQPNFEEKALVQVTNDVASITGQRPQARRAKKSIAGFKTREGQIVGVKVTLRRKKMVDFFEKLVKIILPRVRDFTGIEQKNIDNAGVLNLGIKEHTVFPEINPEKSPITFSFGIAIVPKKRKRDEAVKTYFELGVPLRK